MESSEMVGQKIRMSIGYTGSVVTALKKIS